MIIYDIFSGDGINIIKGESIWGSPIETVNAIYDSQIHEYKNTEFVASDIRIESVDMLKKRIGVIDEFKTEFRVQNATNQIADIYSRMESNPKHHAIVIVDPNGPGVLPFNEILNLTRKFHGRLDLFLNISETAMNRVLNCKVTKDKNWWAGYGDFKNIVVAIYTNYKEAWFRNVIKGDHQRWRFICFWTYAPPKNDWSKQGLMSIKSHIDIDNILQGGTK